MKIEVRSDSILGVRRTN